MAQLARRLDRARRPDPNGEEDGGMAPADPEMDGGDMEGEAPRERRGRGGRGPGGRGGPDGPLTYDVAATVRQLGLTTPEQVVDFYCRTLLANPPGEAMRRALLDYLASDGGLDLRRPAAAREKLHGLLRLIVSTPEFQLS
jgi:hypothetical protein